MSNSEGHWTAESKSHRLGLVVVQDKVLSTWAHVFLGCSAVWLLLLGILNVHRPSDWAMGDWLINYSGGFVRRGLVGAVALHLQQVHVPIFWTVFFLQCSCYAIILSTLWKAVAGLRWIWWIAALVFSPATIAFAFLEPSFALRKEILFFALLCLVLLRVVPLKGDRSGTKPHQTVRLSVLLCVGCSVCVLSHEGLIVYFPYLAAAVWLGFRNFRKSVLVLALPFLLSALLFGLVSRFPGNAVEAEKVCHAIGGDLAGSPSGLCGGAIDYLRRTPDAAHADVRRVYAGAGAGLLPWLFLLPLLPVCLGFADYLKHDARTGRVLIATTSVAWILSVSLFWYGTDWTRWIYIHVFSLLLLLLFRERQKPNAVAFTTATWWNSGALRWVPLGTLIIYCLGWNLSVYGQRPLYGSFFRYVSHSLLRGHP